MKIIKHDEFLLWPDGTIFQKFNPNILEELCVKLESLLESNDFTYESLSIPVSQDHLESMLREEQVFAPFGQTQRDGCFDDEQLYLVWEPMDVRNLIKRLDDILEGFL